MVQEDISFISVQIGDKIGDEISVQIGDDISLILVQIGVNFIVSFFEEREAL